MELNTISDQVIYRLSGKEINARLKELVGIPKDHFLEFEGPRTVELKFGKYNDAISYFIDVFQKNFTPEQTKSMRYRLGQLEIREEWKKLDRIPFYVSLGCYNSMHNKVTLKHYNDQRIPELTNDTLMHELLHMASTRNMKYGHITGLEIPDLIGMNLNEGYTQYLTEKYFTRGMQYVDIDDKRIPIVKGLENLIGAKKMQDYYFNADLPGFIYELQKYASYEDILKLLFTFDRISTPMYSDKKYRLLIKEIAKWNQRKLDMDLAQGKITEDEYDICKAIKVREYRRRCIWSEETEILKDETGFVLSDQGYESKYYPFETPTKKEKEFQKKYQ